MKRCPNCNRIYTDYTFQFCLEDGGDLLIVDDEQETKDFKAPGKDTASKGKWLAFTLIGAAGVLMASQVAAGEENALKIRVYGEKGGLEWAQHEPNTLLVKWLDEPTQILRAGGNYAGRLSSYALHNCRTPGGHPEGYLEAFANLYRNFTLALQAKLDGTTPSPEALDFPSVEDGIRGMAFIDNVVKSSASTEKWTVYEV